MENYGRIGLEKSKRKGGSGISIDFKWEKKESIFVRLLMFCFVLMFLKSNFVRGQAGGVGDATAIPSANGTWTIYNNPSHNDDNNNRPGLIRTLIEMNRQDDEREEKKKIAAQKAENDKLEKKIAKQNDERFQDLMFTCNSCADRILAKYAEVKSMQLYDQEALSYRNQLSEVIRKDPLSAFKTLTQIELELDKEIAKRRAEERRIVITRADKLEKEFKGTSKHPDDFVLNTNQNASEQLKALIKKAESGDPISQCHLAYMCKQGLGLSKDAGLALYWLRQAAKTQDPNAKYFLACDHEENEEYQKSFQIFSELYRSKPPLLEERLYRTVESYLGKAYFYGYGVKQNKSYGMWYFEKAASSGDRVDVTMLEMAKREYSKKSELPPERCGLFDDILNGKEDAARAKNSD